MGIAIESFRHSSDRPSSFLYAVKFSRYGTHMKHLEDPEDTIGNFLEVVGRLKDRLGPILVQIPPKWNVDPDRLAGFLQTAPSDLRWVVEVRDERWLCEDPMILRRIARRMQVAGVETLSEYHRYLLSARARRRGPRTAERLPHQRDPTSFNLNGGCAG
ncbi:MAG: DUF72 domain-containing protein [Gemmatimonadota bacterium]